MPKKDAKKGKKGKGKGKKDGKQESKGDKETDMEKAKANAALWEAKLDVTERSRVEYRESARQLVRANEQLTNQQYRAEKDGLEIFAFLKRRDAEKEEKIVQLERQLREQIHKAAEDSDQLVAQYIRRINELEEMFNERSGEFSMIQGELKTIREFKKKKAHMEQELSDIKESMHLADRGHKDNLSKMEHKFFCEKLRLEKEAEQRIAQLAERAHNEAIVQLDDASRSVFKENVRLNEALGYHVKEEEELRKALVDLAEENQSLALHKETCELMLKDNVSQLKEQRATVAELKGKVSLLERALGRMAGEFGRETQDVQERALRTELERFFQEALAQVKGEIQAGRQHHKRAALQAYQHQMTTARVGRQEYPRVRTFGQSQHSTNGVHGDLEDAEKWAHLNSGKVDISDLTWEQKEKVLRLLFAKMNGLKTRKPTQPPAFSESSEITQNGRDPGVAEEPFHVTFITQATMSSQQPEPIGLPNIKTM
ncbi:hypothetical protein AAFF_G00099520 [Aldrovandia affinis]|uniref:Basal body-orientation factor 1 n=1 Tax=Aldrovandia affinis TaxID=143900 RepID=A0AAD7RV44_9TELE|nr:hypothetical protein AAFF_G00099520 [Aldrovandia affinis]